MDEIEKIERKASQIADRIGGITDLKVQDIFWTQNYIAKANSAKHGPVCIKIAKKIIDEPELIPVGKHPDSEFRAFEQLGSKYAWAPRLIDICEENSWLIREWKGDETVDVLEKEDWTPELLKRLYTVFAEMFFELHNAEEPAIVQDIKLQNITFDDEQMYFIDFGGLSTMVRATTLSIPSRLGSNNFRSRPFEFLAGKSADIDFSSDFFSFSTIFYILVVRKRSLPWPNDLENPRSAIQKMQRIFKTVAPEYRTRLADYGFPEHAIDFLVQSMTPRVSARPKTMPFLS